MNAIMDDEAPDSPNIPVQNVRINWQGNESMVEETLEIGEASENADDAMVTA